MQTCLHLVHLMYDTQCLVVDLVGQANIRTQFHGSKKKKTQAAVGTQGVKQEMRNKECSRALDNYKRASTGGWDDKGTCTCNM